jgi:4-amino-4-deoxy-L-arabinose transferase-like glycosyltransferase
VPQIAWESHRDLTHSVLVTSVSSGFLYVLMTLLHTGRMWCYFMLGLLLGLGALSKHSFLLFVAALLAAVLSQREVRGLLLDRRMLLACALAGVVDLPQFPVAPRPLPSQYLADDPEVGIAQRRAVRDGDRQRA